MSNYIFRLAEENDESELRDILKSNPLCVTREICMAFQKNPNFFYASKIGSRLTQVIIVKYRRNSKIAGLGVRSIISTYINGKVCNIGYLGNLRAVSNYRNPTLLSRGHRYLKTLHQDKKVPIYITTILEGNIYAKNLLTSQRAGLPAYYDFGTYHCVSISLLGKKKKISGDFEIKRGSTKKLDEILECMQRNGSQKQFYPFYTKEDFISNDGILRDFRIEDFYIALKNDKVVGVIAKWDQTSFKQAIVTAYKGKIKILKPFYNLTAKVLRCSPLPKPNSQLHYFYVCFIAIDYNDLQIFKELLKAIYNDTLDAGYSCFLVGLHSKDPLLEAMREYHYITCKSRLYVVCWQDGEFFLKILDDRIPYLEISML